LDPPLSVAQYRLLEMLYEEPGRVYSRDEVVQAVWPEDDRDGISEQAIDAMARRLRERLAETDPITQYVITVRGHGFRLENAAK
jgi:DNA-binding response OmpR family regulator